MRASGRDRLRFEKARNDMSDKEQDRFSDSVHPIDGAPQRPIALAAGNCPIVLAKELSDGEHTLTLSAKQPNGIPFRIAAFLTAKQTA